MTKIKLKTAASPRSAVSFVNELPHLDDSIFDSPSNPRNEGAVGTNVTPLGRNSPVPEQGQGAAMTAVSEEAAAAIKSYHIKATVSLGPRAPLGSICGA